MGKLQQEQAFYRAGDEVEEGKSCQEAEKQRKGRYVRRLGKRYVSLPVC